MEPGNSKMARLVILFHATWCGYCKKLINEGIWKSVSGRMSEQGFEPRMVESKQLDTSRLARYYAGKGYPQIVVVDNGVKVAEKMGYASSAEAIVSDLTSQMHQANYRDYGASMAAYGASMAAYYDACNY